MKLDPIDHTVLLNFRLFCIHKDVKNLKHQNDCCWGKNLILVRGERHDRIIIFPAGSILAFHIRFLMCTEQFETKTSGRTLQVEGFCALRIDYISHNICFYIMYKSAVRSFVS